MTFWRRVAVAIAIGTIGWFFYWDWTSDESADDDGRKPSLAIGLDEAVQTEIGPEDIELVDESDGESA
jgi:hypothetical protein